MSVGVAVRCCRAVVAVSLAMLLLAGCAGRSGAPVVSGHPDPVMQQRLQAVSAWRIEGKLAVRSRAESQSARLQWQQHAGDFDIRLSGPAGLRATHVYSKPGAVVLEQGDEIHQAASAEDLSEQLIGWPLPARELVDWLRGLPSPALPVGRATYDEQGRLVELQQGDWRIRFAAHATVNDLALPQRIEAVRVGGRSAMGEVSMTLLVKRWDLPAAASHP